MQLKTLLYLPSIIMIMHIEQTYLHVLSHELRKLKWIWYIFQYSISGVIYFQSINSLLLFSDIDLELMKDQTLIIKILKLIHTRSPRILQNLFTKLVYKLWFAYVSVYQVARIRLFILGGAIWTFSALYSFSLMFGLFCPTGFFPT